MKSFSEWKSTNESMYGGLGNYDREAIWGMVHNLKPFLVPKLKKLIEEFSQEYAGEGDPKHMSIAISQILLDLTKEYDPKQ